jgi:hypothetical protein
VQPPCCYYLDVVPAGPCCGGRPLLVEGVARTAPVVRRGEWEAEIAPDVARLDPKTRSALALAWADDARYEHASIASFARLSLELLSVGAPPALLSDAQRALGDEIAHARLAFGLAAAYGGAPVGAGPLDLTGVLPASTLVSVAVAAVREGCIGETIAALIAAEALAVARDPAVISALERIARDEADHAASAYRLVAWAVRSGGEEVRAAVARAFDEPFTLPAAQEIDADLDALRAHGRIAPRDVRGIAERALAEVVAPSARALLG